MNTEGSLKGILRHLKMFHYQAGKGALEHEETCGDMTLRVFSVFTKVLILLFPFKKTLY